MSFEVLCVTMHQTDFSKIEAMNIRSDVVFANQADRTSYEEKEFDGHTAKMITTATRGVGKNRNLALTYASADICLFADDDVRYIDDMEERVLSEFAAHPDADVIIFHFETDDPNRPQPKPAKSYKVRLWSRMPWAGFKIAFRLNSVKKANLWFTTLFGGGCLYPSGEDSMWLSDARRAGLRFYVSKETIGTVSFATSTWFTGYDEKHSFAKGAYHQAVHPKTFIFWALYTLFRYRGQGRLSLSQKWFWMKRGKEGYQKMQGFEAISNANRAKKE